MSEAPATAGGSSRASLSHRAALFVLTGGGALLGAIFVLSGIIVDESKARLLDERMAFARAAGALLEHRLRGDLGALVERVAAGRGPGRVGVFDGGFVVGGAGAPEDGGGLPRAPPELAGASELSRTIAEARARGGVAVSTLFRFRGQPAIAAVAPLSAGEPKGAQVVGLLHPDSNDLLHAVRGASELAHVGLVDANGVFVASTDPSQRFTEGDHGGVIARAIEEKKEFRGRCHRCHDPEATLDDRTTEVLAFAPLPTLALGLTVLQPEAEALAVAFSLRDWLWLFGAPVLVLFLAFVLLAVRSVVRPVTRLTEAVRAATPEGAGLPGGFGDDEVGELARALERWRSRTAESLAETARERLECEAARDRQRQQQQVLHKVLTAQEDERRRVARELHDTLAQDLSALRLEIERLGARADAALSPALADLEARTRAAHETTRRILLDLRSSVLESAGLVAAARLLVERVEREHGLKARLVIDGDEDAPIDPMTAIALYRILQEALANAVEHAGAELVLVEVRVGADRVELRVEDDGKGFDPVAARARQDGELRGLGLLGAEERARLIGGELTVTSAPGEGTTIAVSAPRAPPRRTSMGPHRIDSGSREGVT